MDTKNYNAGDGNNAFNTHVNPLYLHDMRRLVDELVTSPTVRKTVGHAIARGMAPYATPFERYMSRVLRDAGGDDLGRRIMHPSIQLLPPGEGSLAQIICADSISTADKQVIESVQGAINRLCSMVDALEDSADLLDAPKPYTITISGLGGAFRDDRPLYRSAHIPLPEIGVNEQPDMAYLNEVDWRALDHVAVIARAIFQSSMLPNMHQAFMGAFAPAGSDWDVRTRLASILGRLELPLACSFTYDCSIPQSLVVIHFTAPPLNSFPHLSGNGAAGTLIESGERLADARDVYIMRLTCLLAAAGFGAGRHLERVELVAFSQDAPLLSCVFNRHDFVHKTLTRIADYSLFGQNYRFDVNGIEDLISAEELILYHSEGKRVHSNEPTREIELSQALHGCKRNRIRRTPAHEDTRALPANMAQLFHTRRICDIDTRHYFGGRRDTIEIARLDSNESILAAIAALEQTIADLEFETVPPDDDADARPLFCSNPLARAVVSLLDDDLAISLEAERFLDSSFATPSEALESMDVFPRYFRAPDALYQAHVGLSDLYSRLGDYRGAEAEANKCIALAPTSAQSYYLKADALARQDRYVEASNVLVCGLRYAASERDCALLYYHLALVLWKMGREQESAAVHIYTMSLAGEHAEKSAAIVRSLRKRANKPIIVHASPLAATREMAKARIPIAPSDETRTLVAQAAIGLSCADAPEAAAPYAAALGRYFHNDPVLVSTTSSIIHGLSS